jgi:hypothetical protein
MSPTISTKKTAAKRGFISRQSMAREEMVFYIAAGVSAATLIIHLVIHLIISSSSAGVRERNLAAAQSNRVLQLGEAKFNHDRMRALGEKVKNDDPEAGERRRAEMERRLDLDPQYSHTPREEAMLKMQALGGSTAGDAQTTLEQIALLAPPLGGNPPPLAKATVSGTGFNLEIAYPCKVVLDHSLVGQKPRNYYREVVRTTAGIVKDAMAFGSNRGVNQLLVTCWSEVTVGTAGTQGSSKEVRHQFVVTAAPDNRDWLRMPRADVEKTWRKKTDNLRQLLLEQDPN